MVANSEQEQSKQLESMRTLGNKRLDAAELNFLKSQDKLLLDFADTTEKNLLTDIKEANRNQIQKDVRLNELLNGYIIPENFHKIAENIMPKIKISNTFESINLYKGICRKFDSIVGKYASDPTGFWPKMFMIRFMLDVYNGNVKPGYEEGKFVIFDGKFVKMLHEFQKKTNSDIEGRSEVDCIVGKRTIQQLAAYTGIGVVAGEVQIGSEFTMSSEIQKKEKYNRVELVKYIKQIEKNQQISPTQKINDILEIYSKLPEEDREKKTLASSNKKISNRSITIKDFVYEVIQNIASIYQIDVENINNQSLKEYFAINFSEIVDLQEVNQKKLTVALGLANAWMRYYEQESPRGNRKLLPLITEGIQHLQNLQNQNSSKDINKEIQSAMALVLWPTDFNLFDSDFQQRYIRTRKSGKFASLEDFSDTSTVPIQEYTFRKMSDLIIGNTNRDDNGMISLRNNLLEQFRMIDAKYDGGIFDDYKSGEPILAEMESYSGTSQSIMSMKIEENGTKEENKEYRKYNTDIANVNMFFADLTKTDGEGNLSPDPQKMQLFETIFSEIDKGNIKIVHHSASTISTPEVTINAADARDELLLPSSVSKAVNEAFGFGLSQVVWEKIINDYKKIKNQIEQNKSIILEEARKTYKKEKDNIESDIQYYRSMIQQFTNDVKVDEWKMLLEGLEKTKSSMMDEGSIGYDTPLYADDPESTVNKIIEGQKKSYFGQILENACVYRIMLAHEKGAIKNMQNKKNKTDQENMIDIYTNVLGIGSYMSDKTFNMIVAVTKEVIVQVVICAVSMGIGNLVAKGVMVGTKRALNTVKLTNAANKVGRFYKLGVGNIVNTFKLIERGVSMGKITKTTASMLKLTTTLSRSGRMVAAGSIFHASSTVLNNVYVGQDLRTGVNPLGYTEYVDENGNVQRMNNYRGYLQSIAFFGVLEIISPGIQGLLNKAKGDSKKINEIMNNVMKKKVNIKEFKVDFAAWARNNVLIPAGSITGELASLMATETILSVAFDQKLPSFDAESIIHMIGMIVGLRMTHGIKLGLEGKMDTYMIKKVEYKKNDITSIERVTFEIVRDGKKYETTINDKSKVVNTNDPMFQKTGSGKRERQENRFDNLSKEEIQRNLDDINRRLSELESSVPSDINEMKVVKSKMESASDPIKKKKLQDNYDKRIEDLNKKREEIGKLQSEKTELLNAKNAPKNNENKQSSTKKNGFENRDAVLQEGKIEVKSGEILESTIERAMNQAKEMGGEYVVVVKNDIKNSEVFVVKKNTDFPLSVEMRFQDGRIEIGSRENGLLNGEGYRTNKNGDIFEGVFLKGKLHGNGKIERTNGTKESGYFENGLLKNGKRIFSNGIVFEGIFEGQYLIDGKKTTSTGEVYQGEFKLGDLRSGKVIAKNGTVIKEYFQGKEVPKTEVNFENIKSFDELYREIDKIESLVSESNGETYTAKELKMLIEEVKNGKKELNVITRTGGLRGKVEELIKMETKTEFERSKCSYEAEEFVKEYGEPVNLIEVGDGIIYTTNVLRNGNYKYVVGYTWYNGKFEPRIFYRSGSEGNRRSCPGERSNGGFSKAEFLNNQSYETTTKVSPEIGAKFDGFSVENVNKGIISFSKTKFGTDFLKDQMKESVSVEDKMFKEYDSASDFYSGRYAEDVVNDYKNLTIKGLNYKNMEVVEGKEYSYAHDFLGEVDVVICRAKYNGKDVDIHFARAKNSHPDQVWIENIVYSDAKVNSFGVYDKQINAGPLTAKPLDYAQQVPYEFHTKQGKDGPYFDPEYVHTSNAGGFMKGYIDIRELYQESPLIKYAKENILQEELAI